MSIGGVIVTYNPDLGKLKIVIDNIVDQVDKLLIVDNNSRNVNEIHEMIMSNRKIELLENNENYGIGTALNDGVEIFKGTMDWILTLDQDSVVMAPLQELIIEAAKVNKQVGVISLNYIGKGTEEGVFFEDFSIIISGCIVNSSVFKADIRYREEFFMDYIDTDFSYQLRKKGFIILRTMKKYLDHKVGTRVELKNGEVIYYETEQRLYLTTRNLFKLCLERELNFFWFFEEVLKWDFMFLRARGIKKGVKLIIKINCRGASDSIRNRFGPPPLDLI
jgi:rhamnosyltransferase